MLTKEKLLEFLAEESRKALSCRSDADLVHMMTVATARMLTMTKDLPDCDESQFTAEQIVEMARAAQSVQNL